VSRVFFTWITSFFHSLTHTLPLPSFLLPFFLPFFFPSSFWSFFLFFSFFSFFGFFLPQMPKPFDPDLRLRIVRQVLVLRRSVKQVALDNMVSKRTVSRYLKQMEKEESLDPKRNKGKKPAVTGDAGARLTCLVTANPTISLREIQEALEKDGIQLALSSISKTLARLGFNRQTFTRNAKQRSEYLRALYIEDISEFTPEQLIFYDEMGAVRTIPSSFFLPLFQLFFFFDFAPQELSRLRPRTGLSLRGVRAISNVRFGRSRRYTLLAAVSLAGPFSAMILDTNVDGPCVLSFLEHRVLPSMNPFPGPNSVLVLGLFSLFLHLCDPLF